MEDLHAQAQLVALDRAGAIGTVVTRAEIAEAAAGSEFPATFLLDLDRVEADGAEVVAHAKVAIDWDQETLEQILAATPDNEVQLWFDERELTRAFDDDVEAHGLRQRAAVLAVAVAAAGATAAPSLAMVDGGASSGGGGAGITAGYNVNPQATGSGPAVQPAGAERGLLQDEKIAVQQTTGGGTAVTSSNEGGTLSTGELAGAAAAGALLISAAGFGVAKRRTPPAQPA